MIQGAKQLLVNPIEAAIGHDQNFVPTLELRGDLLHDGIRRCSLAGVDPTSAQFLDNLTDIQTNRSLQLLRSKQGTKHNAVSLVEARSKFLLKHITP